MCLSSLLFGGSIRVKRVGSDARVFGFLHHFALGIVGRDPALRVLGGGHSAVDLFFARLGGHVDGIELRREAGWKTRERLAGS